MDDTQFGTRDKRGNWTPGQPASHAPLFAFPPRPLALLRWLPHYFLPWNLLWAASALAWWAEGDDLAISEPGADVTVADSGAVLLYKFEQDDLKKLTNL